MRDRKGKLFLDFWTFGDKNKYLRIEYFIFGKMGFEYLDHRRYFNIVGNFTCSFIIYF